MLCGRSGRSAHLSKAAAAGTRGRLRFVLLSAVSRTHQMCGCARRTAAVSVQGRGTESAVPQRILRVAFNRVMSMTCLHLSEPPVAPFLCQRFAARCIAVGFIDADAKQALPKESVKRNQKGTNQAEYKFPTWRSPNGGFGKVPSKRNKKIPVQRQRQQTRLTTTSYFKAQRGCAALQSLCSLLACAFGELSEDQVQIVIQSPSYRSVAWPIDEQTNQEPECNATALRLRALGTHQCSGEPLGTTMCATGAPISPKARNSSPVGATGLCTWQQSKNGRLRSIHVRVP